MFARPQTSSDCEAALRFFLAHRGDLLRRQLLDFLRELRNRLRLEQVPQAELDTEGVSQPDLTVLDSGQLSAEVAGARQTLRSRHGVPVNWFNYPSGRYDADVVAAVRGEGAGVDW